MAWAHDATTQNTRSVNDPWTLTHTCSTSATLLVCVVSTTNGRGTDTSNPPTYASTAMTGSGEGFVKQTEAGVEVWYRKNPAEGANTLSIPNTGAVSIKGWALSFDSAAGSPTVAGTTSNTATSSTISLSLAVTADNCLVIGAVGCGNRDVPSQGTGYNMSGTEDIGNQTWGIEYDLDHGTGSPVTVDFGTSRSDDWGLIGIAFEEPSGSTPTNITVTQGVITVASHSVTVNDADEILVGQGVVTVSSHTVQVNDKTAIAVGQGAITVASHAVTVNDALKIEVGQGVVTVNAKPVTIESGGGVPLNIDVTQGVVTVASQAPVVNDKTNLAVGQGVVTVASHEVTVNDVLDMVISQGVVTVASHGVTVNNALDIEVSQGAVVVNAKPAAMKIDRNLLLTQGVVVVNAKPVDVSQVGITTISVTQGVITVAAQAPGVNNALVIEVGQGAVAVASKLVTMKIDRNLLLTQGVIVVNGKPASIDQAGVTDIAVTKGAVAVASKPVAINEIPWNLPSSVSVSVGSIDSGTVDDTHSDNGVELVINETNGTPGFTFDLVFGEENSASTTTLDVNIYGYYDGNPAHNVKLQQYNYNTTSWTNVTADANDFPAAGAEQTYQFSLIDDANYQSGGQLQLRFNHTSAGNQIHNFHLDFVRLATPTNISVGLGQVVAAAINPTISEGAGIDLGELTARVYHVSRLACGIAVASKLSGGVDHYSRLSCGIAV